MNSVFSFDASTRLSINKLRTGDLNNDGEINVLDIDFILHV